MSQNEPSIIDVPDEDWENLVEKANREQWKHFCVFPRGWRYGLIWLGSSHDPGCRIYYQINSIGLDAVAGTYCGNFPAELLAALPKDLARLVLVEQSIDDLGAQAIAENLPQLTTLGISSTVIDNKIGEMGARAIAENLTQLTTLEISSNDIGETGARAIAKNLTQLTTLEIGHNKIGKAGAQAIAENLTQLTTLDIGGNSIGETGAQAIAENLTQLTTLDIGANSIGDTGAQAIAENLNRLSTLSIWGNEIGVPGAKAITENLVELAALYISYNSLGETGVQAIAETSVQLDTLDVRYQSIGKKGAQAIAENLTQLTTLYFSQNSIGDSGAQAIAKGLKQLNELEICSDSIGDSGAQAIAENLKQLTRLNFSHNKIGETGAQAIAENLKQLTRLNFSHNKIGETGAQAIAENLKNLTTLDLSGNDCGIPEDVLIGSDAKRIREYFASTRREGAQKVDSFKLLILGQGEVGKTHMRENFARFNQGELPKYYDEQLDRTHDIDIQNVPLKLDDGTVTARVWDFGGQQFLHASHRFFLSGQRCLYLIAVDATRPPDGKEKSNQLSYWIRMVQHYGQSPGGKPAPLMVAMTHCDCHIGKPADDPLTINYQANLKAIEGLIERGVLAKENFITGIGWHPIPTAEENELTAAVWQAHLAAFQQLHDRVCELAPSIPGMEMIFGPEYFAMRKWINETFESIPEDAANSAIPETVKRFDLQTNVAFRQLCEQEKISPENVTNYLSILHSAGMLHWLGDRDEIKNASYSEHLRTNVFNPAWIKSPTYKLIRSQDRSDWKGHLNAQAIKQCLPAPADPKLSELLYERLHFSETDRSYVQDLMVACRVAFEVKNGPKPDGLIFPDHLDARQGPSLNFEGDNVLRWRLETSFLPEHVFLQFIARHHHEVLGNQFLCRDEVQLPCKIKGQELQVLLKTDLSPGFGVLPGIDLSVQGGTELCRQLAAQTFITVLNQIMSDEGLESFDTVEESRTLAADDANIPISLCEEDRRRIIRLDSVFKKAGIETTSREQKIITELFIRSLMLKTAKAIVNFRAAYFYRNIFNRLLDDTGKKPFEWNDIVKTLQKENSNTLQCHWNDFGDASAATKDSSSLQRDFSRRKELTNILDRVFDQLD